MLPCGSSHMRSEKTCPSRRLPYQHLQYAPAPRGHRPPTGGKRVPSAPRAAKWCSMAMPTSPSRVFASLCPCLAVVTSRARAYCILSGVWLWLRPAHAHVIFRAVSGCGYVPRTCILYFIFYILSGVWLRLCPAHTCIMFSYGISIEISGNFQFLRGEEVVDSVRLGERQIKDYSPQ